MPCWPGTHQGPVVLLLLLEGGQLTLEGSVPVLQQLAEIHILRGEGDGVLRGHFLSQLHQGSAGEISAKENRGEKRKESERERDERRREDSTLGIDQMLMLFTVSVLHQSWDCKICDLNIKICYIITKRYYVSPDASS